MPLFVDLNGLKRNKAKAFTQFDSWLRGCLRYRETCTYVFA